MASPTSISNDQADVVRVLEEYYSAFSTLNVEAILPYFHEPSLLIGPQGAFAATTHALLATAVTPTMEGLRARGFGRTELSVRDFKSLSATATLLGGVALRYKADGQELDHAGVTYVLHKADARWKIAVLIIHDPNENELRGSELSHSE
jgi:ketosteroid isomerase-like protein